MFRNMRSYAFSPGFSSRRSIGVGRWLVLALICALIVPAVRAQCPRVDPPGAAPFVILPWLPLMSKTVTVSVTTNTVECSTPPTLVSGTVRVLLVKDGVSYYCGEGTLQPKGTGKQTQAVTVTIPLTATGPRLGSWQVQQYVIANFSNGAKRTETSTLNFTSKNCVPLL